MKKKLLALCLVVVLAVSTVVGATMAYFTDTDEDVNVMTVGNVEIEQNEQDRNGNDFEQNQALMPIVTPTSVKDSNGYPACENYIDKIVTVTNTGKSDAYVRTFIAIPEFTYDGQPEGEAAYANVLHWNGYSYGDTADKYPAAVKIPGGDYATNYWWWGTEDQAAWPGNAEGWNSFKAEIDGKMYTVYVVTNVDVVEPGETTAPNMIGLYLDSKVDYDGVNYTYEGKVIEGLDETVEVLVATQAVQTAGFDNAWDALEAAFQTPSATNHPWIETVFVSTADELAEAVKAGEKIVLTADITVNETITTASGTNVSIDGNGFTITAATSGNMLTTYGGTVELSDLTITGTAVYAVYNQGGNVTMNNVTVEMDGSYVVNMYGGGNVVLNDCTVTGENGDGAAQVWFGDGRTVTINGGEYSSVAINASKGSGNGSKGNLTVNDATIGRVYVGAYVDANGEIQRANYTENNAIVNEVAYEDEVKGW